tara:strand:- start:532 stop:771 length:240 start_codon:yes stop_codon:yes gene_type:complete
MQFIQRLMIEHPIIARISIFPFSLIVVIGIFSFLVEIILPLLIAVFFTNFIFKMVTGKCYKDKFYEKFSFGQTDFYSTR